MREAVIVSTARTPIGRAYRGAFNNTDSPGLGGHAISHAVARAGLDPAEVEDVIMGCALTQGSQGRNIARHAALAADLPVTVGGMTLDRQCSSGMMAIASAAKSIINDENDIMVGGGLDSISIVQNEHMNTYRMVDPLLVAKHQHIPWHHSRRREEHTNYRRQQHQCDDFGLTHFQVIAPTGHECMCRARTFSQDECLVPVPFLNNS